MKISLLKTLCLLAGFLLSMVNGARAASVTNADAAVTLNLAGSWVLGTPPGTGDVAVWDHTVQINTNKTLGASLSWGGIRVADPGALITLGADGNNLTLGASGIDLSAATNNLLIVPPLVLSASQTWQVTNGQTLTVYGIISGSSLLTLNNGGNNGGTVVLTNANTYTGGTLINSGFVIPYVITSFGAGEITNTGGDIQFNNFTHSGIMTNPWWVTGTSLLDMDNINASFVLNGAWSGPGTILVTNDTASGSTLTFGGASSSANMANFTGSIIVVTNASGTPSAGTLRFNNGGGLYNVGSAAMAINLGTNSTIVLANRDAGTTSIGQLTGGPGTTVTGQTSGSGTENWSIGGSFPTDTFAGAFVNKSSSAITALTKVGANTLVLTGTNTFTGPVTINAGVLQIGDGGADGVLGGGAIVNNASLVFNRSDNFTALGNAISGSGSLVIQAGGTVTYTGADTSSGTTIISQGDLVLSGSGSIAGPISVASGSTFDVSQLASFNLNQPLSGSGTITGAVTVVTGSISPGGTGTAGTLNFLSGLTESGNINNLFVLSTPGGTNDLVNVTGNLTLTGTNYVSLTAFGGGTIPNGIYPLFAYTGTLTGGTTNFLVTAVGVTGTLTNLTTTPPELAVIIAPTVRGATNLFWKGDGVANNWDITTSNWFNGPTAFNFQSGDRVFFTDAGAPNTNVNLALAVQPASVVVSNTQTYVLAGVGGIVGTTGLTKTNTGLLSISTTNSYTGPTVVGAGTLQIFNIANGVSPSALGAASSNPTNLVFYGSTLAYAGPSTSTDRGATLNGAGATFDIVSGTILTNNGTLTGTGALTLVDSGTLALGSANTYTGGTVLSNGVLAAANQTANISGFGPATNPITFYGGTLTLDNSTYDDSATVYSFANPLVVPAGQTGTLNVFERGEDSGALTGGGTLNISALGQRGAFSGNWSAFTGTLILTGNFRIENTYGYSNAVIHLNAGADLDGGTSGGVYSSSPTFDIGELDGTNGATLGAVSKPTPNPTWRVGWKNTTGVFAGTIQNPSGGTAGITKVGTGIWYLSGQNTYSGSTLVSQGTLALTNNFGSGSDGSINNSTNIYLSPGATFDVTGLQNQPWYLGSGQFIGGGGAVNGAISAGSGTFILPGGSAGSGTLTINGALSAYGGTAQILLSSPGGTNDLIQVNGNLNTSGGNLIQVGGFGGGTIANGTYPLINFTGTWSSSSGTADFTLELLGDFPNSFSLTSSAHVISLVVGPLPRAATNVVWVGDSSYNYWDTTSPNWSIGGVAGNMFEFGDSVFFTDTGSDSPSVTLNGFMYPAAVVVSNSAESYTFAGTGGIGGPTGLVKTNNGTLTIQNNNTYTGPTVIGGGTLSIATVALSGSPSSIGAAGNNSTNVVFAGGTLAYTGSSATTDHGMTLNASGGTVDINGSTLTVSGVITGTGPLILTDSGQLTLSGANTFTGNIIINGGTLSDTNGQNVNYPVVGGLGNPQIAGRTVTINNGGTLSLDFSGGNEFGGGSVTNQLGFVINAGGLMRITGGNATIGPVTLNGGTMDSSGTAGTSTQYGAFEFGADLTVGGATSSTIQTEVGSPYCLTIDSFTPYRVFNVTNVNGVLNVSAAFCNSGGSQGAAGLFKAGPGTMTLTAVNLYSGNTIVTNGTLLVNGGGSLSNAPVYIVGGVLGGSGTINGAITNQPGGTLEPGAEVASPGTTLTCNSNVTLQLGSTTLMQVSHNAGTDQIYVGGTLTYGGVLMVATNAGDSPAYQVGDSFTLFNLTSSGTYNAGSSFATIQPPPGPGLGWSGANLTVNGQIQVVAASAVTANFTQTTGSGTLPLTVTFNNTSSGAAYWVWNFGDGATLLTTSNTNVPHTYTTAGSFTVVLTAYGPGGTSTKTVVGAVVATYAAPLAAFSGSPTNIFLSQAVTFTDASTGTITNWLWNLGDGTTVTNSSNASVVHAYPATGSYTVSLTVGGPGGANTATRTAYIVVKPKVSLGATTLANGNLVFSGVNGPVGQQYRILNTTNLTLPLANWAPVYTNSFAAPNGGFSYTNAPGTNAAGFFLLVSP